MPEAAPPTEPQDPQGADDAQAGGDQDVGQQIVDLDKRIGAFGAAVTQNPNVPDDLKQKIGSSVDALRSAIGELVDSVSGGGGGGPAPSPGGVVTPEQGGGRSVPVRA